MRRKNLFIPMMLSLSMIGCSNKSEEVMGSVQTVEPTEIASIIETETETETETEIVIDKTTETIAEVSYTEYGDLYLLDSGCNAGIQVDMAEWDLVNKEYTLKQGINVYYTDTSLAGYTKDNITVATARSNDEWYFCVFDKSGYLVKAEDLISSVSNDDVEEEVSPNELVKETINGETTVQPAEEGVAEPIVEPPIVAESTKYTPEEAIAVYRSIMEANGIKWNPDLKNGGSWGTGWIYLEKGQPERAASTNLESAKMGNGDGVPWDNYYLEVTGSDENAVYITEWAD